MGMVMTAKALALEVHFLYEPKLENNGRSARCILRLLGAIGKDLFVNYMPVNWFQDPSPIPKSIDT